MRVLKSDRFEEGIVWFDRSPVADSMLNRRAGMSFSQVFSRVVPWTFRFSCEIYTSCSHHAYFPFLLRGIIHI